MAHIQMKTFLEEAEKNAKTERGAPGGVRSPWLEYPRSWNNDVTSQGRPGDTRSCKRKEPPLGSLEGVGPPDI